MASPPLHNKILSTPAVPQPASPLFVVLPAEVRTDIFALALTDYPDPSPTAHYEAATCYTRPSYFAPRRSDTELLRTCRAVYAETWFLPFFVREQTHWLTSQDRAPPEHRVGIAAHDRLRDRLHRYVTSQTGGSGGTRMEIAGLRVFAQMYMLERGTLKGLLSTPMLRPLSLTLTIRHADWWYWEDDEPLRFEGGWIRRVSQVMPSSVRELCIELESLERKKDQVMSIAQQMVERWFFKREDGLALYPDSTARQTEISRWSGTSTWHGKRWIRDETEPDRIDYYIATVRFRPEWAVLRRGGSISSETRHAAENNIFDTAKLKLHVPNAKRLPDRPPSQLESDSHSDFGEEEMDEEVEWEEEDEDYWYGHEDEDEGEGEE